MNYFIEFDLSIDIILIVYTFCAKILLFQIVLKGRYMKIGIIYLFDGISIFVGYLMPTLKRSM